MVDFIGGIVDRVAQRRRADRERDQGADQRRHRRLEQPRRPRLPRSDPVINMPQADPATSSSAGAAIDLPDIPQLAARRPRHRPDAGDGRRSRPRARRRRSRGSPATRRPGPGVHRRHRAQGHGAHRDRRRRHRPRPHAAGRGPASGRPPTSNPTLRNVRLELHRARRRPRPSTSPAPARPASPADVRGWAHQPVTPGTVDRPRLRGADRRRR